MKIKFLFDIVERQSLQIAGRRQVWKQFCTVIVYLTRKLHIYKYMYMQVHKTVCEWSQNKILLCHLYLMISQVIFILFSKILLSLIPRHKLKIALQRILYYKKPQEFHPCYPFPQLPNLETYLSQLFLLVFKLHTFDMLILLLLNFQFQ